MSEPGLGRLLFAFARFGGIAYCVHTYGFEISQVCEGMEGGKGEGRGHAIPWANLCLPTRVCAPRMMCVYVCVCAGPQSQGPSMLPTFNATGDLLYVDKLFLRWFPLQRNDIVTAFSPQTDGQHVCKRVLGTPGQFVRVASGDVFKVGE